MKKTVLNYLVIAALAVVAVFTSCNNDDNDGNDNIGLLLETITFDDGGYAQLEYDDKNRITIISEYSEECVDETTFTYIGNDLVKVVSVYSKMEFAKSGTKITFKGIWNNESIEGTINLNKDGLPSKKEWKIEYDNNPPYYILFVQTYEYLDGNLISFEIYQSSPIYDVSAPILVDGGKNAKHITVEYHNYDDNKSPFYYCKTPKWYWICFSSEFVFGYKNNPTNIFMDGAKSELIYEYNSDRFPIKCTRVGERENIIEYKYK